ncbi:hypothetical protein CupriaWKF_30360 [Cupriavidus sp. WKF15]|uniref:hypothetical protein n=1 Tax=Cupriavidus sp. WKF15 TaxID=3032282 RepID=UPI0023E1A3F0|nr:hypothetical protein [Cupriavidus sp. WKF15]WER50669.1 hypothetical protein CupriaWKF_30360 [Cupriavidus sp. WKF15]
MSAPSVVRCIVSAPSDECLSDVAALCRSLWASLLNPYSHVHDELVCCEGGGETVGKLADSHLDILPVGSAASHGQTLELVATPEPGRHVPSSLLETILSAVLMPHVKALVSFDVYWTTIQGPPPDPSKTS